MLHGGRDNEEKVRDEGHLSHDIGEADEEDHEHGAEQDHDHGAEQGNDDDVDVGADNEREVGERAKAIDDDL